MSEYQYYEFQAIDRKLTAADMQALRALSSSKAPRFPMIGSTSEIDDRGGGREAGAEIDASASA